MTKHKHGIDPHRIVRFIREHNDHEARAMIKSVIVCTRIAEAEEFQALAENLMSR